MNSCINILIDEITSKNKAHKKFLYAEREELFQDEVNNLEVYIQCCLNMGLSIQYLADAYNLLVNDAIKEQIFFEKNKRYRYCNYADVASSVYMNDKYMSKYMYGLAISMFFWPQHREIMRFFAKTIINEKGERYLEIGPGHGLFMLKAMQLGPFDFFEGIDISPASVNITNIIIKYNYIKQTSNYNIYQQDFLKLNREYDFIIMGEVLEHVEEPLSYLKKLFQLSHYGAHIFITTCINSAMIDHIYLFKSIKDLEELIESSGLNVNERLIIPYRGLSIKETEEQQLPMNCAYVLSKNPPEFQNEKC
ncbi:MAG: hypothetical protein A2X77_04765 [Gammaproteobacteria bacterium GWE2_42_36]|nr:MAG: hypothetical protein A2X77_04765 [Gammaproteobacteria bacterium GWE2_42_36]